MRSERMRNVKIRTLKTAIAALASLLLANALGLEFAAAAAIVAILSVFDTRKATLKGSIQRVLSALMALLIGTIAFTLCGYNPWAFGVYLLFFVPASFYFDLALGLGPSSVLVTHLLAFGEMTPAIFLNEMGLMIIGTGFAVLTNVYAPSEEEHIEELLNSIDKQITDLLNIFAQSITKEMEIDQYRDNFINLKKDIQEAERLSIQEQDNRFNTIDPETLYRISYLKDEVRILNNMFNSLNAIPPQFKEGGELAYLLDNTSTQLTKQGAILEIEELLNVIEKNIIGLPLPKTPEDMYNRSLLHQSFRDYKEYIELRSSYNKLTDQMDDK